MSSKQTHAQVYLPEKEDSSFETGLIARTAAEAKEKEIPFLPLLKQRITVVEVSV